MKVGGRTAYIVYLTEPEPVTLVDEAVSIHGDSIFISLHNGMVTVVGSFVLAITPTVTMDDYQHISAYL